MSDLLQRLLKMQQSFNSNKPAHQRYNEAMSNGLNQLNLSELPSEFRKKLEHYACSVNQIVQGYPIKTNEDLHLISDAHLDEMFEYAKKVYRLLCRCEARIGPALN
jgi:hypothetical protein